MSLSLFNEATMGGIKLRNRFVMAPMTRCRAIGDTLLPGRLQAEYYAQRASAGLVISEGTVISPRGTGYLHVPGIYLPEQIEAWKLSTAAVHEQGGKIFLQLWHVGRLSHPDLIGGQLPLAPSAINPEVAVYTPAGKKETPVPQEMSHEDIRQSITSFVQGALNAREAGFDGVELHASNGYLLHQFFADCSNRRRDEYGGSAENKTRILFELLDALKLASPDFPVGIRLNPMLHGMLGMQVDNSTEPTFSYLIERLNDYNLAYLHLSQPATASNSAFFVADVVKHFRPLYKGFLIANGGYSAESAAEALSLGLADAIAFGRPFISNPDYPERIRNGWPLAPADPSTFYSAGAQGYTTYPAYMAKD